MNQFITGTAVAVPFSYHFLDAAGTPNPYAGIIAIVISTLCHIAVRYFDKKFLTRKPKPDDSGTTQNNNSGS